jgi:CRP/FNR family transcriptional regulator
VRVYQLSPAGKEHVLHLAGPGQTFLEVAVLGGFTSPAFCEASEPSTCLALPATALQGLLRDDHELCLRVLAGMSGWVRHLVGLLEDIVLRDAVGRVTRYLLEIAGQRGPKFELPVLKKHVASHLNLTSETFSRTLRRLTEAELIAMEGGVVRLLDVDGLREAAEGVYPRL